MEIPSNKKIYFSSDNHLGAPSHKESLVREKIFIDWLDSIKNDAEIIFLLGDLFDFWFEYKEAVPKGFTRVLGKLAELTDSGIKIYFFVGNHDLWMENYFEEELNIKIFRKPELFIFNSKSFFIGHGDGLGPGDFGYKRMKLILSNTFFIKLFRLIHPDIGIRLGKYLSQKNKLISGTEDLKFKGEDKEWLIQFSIKKLEEEHIDYFIFGHRHLPLVHQLKTKSKYINLGDWITHYTYGVFDGKTFNLRTYSAKND
ncbi:MAG: UDP-2,3-diacylglucosamine diphosphatase [Bacteroidota bacterium]